MYHRVRRKMVFSVCAIVLLNFQIALALPKTLDSTETTLSTPSEENYENNIINFDDEYIVKFDKKYGTIPWHSNDKLAKEVHKYTVVKDGVDAQNKTNVKTNEITVETTTATTSYTTVNKNTVADGLNVTNNTNTFSNETNVETTVTSANPIDVTETIAETEYSVIPLELVSTTENILASIIESTTEDELLVIPLSTTVKDFPVVEINQTVTLPTSTQESDVTTEEIVTTTSNDVSTTIIVQTRSNFVTNYTVREAVISNTSNNSNKTKLDATLKPVIKKSDVTSEIISSEDTSEFNATDIRINRTIHEDVVTVNKTENITRIIHVSEEVNDKDVPLFTELDSDDEEVPEDYYDAKDVVPTTAPKVNAISVLVGLAGSVVESVAERVVPKGIFDLFKRMQKQNEALEAERLRSREENGGLGQFGRGILKSISSGLGKPLSQLMAGVRDIGSLDTDRGFVSNLASSVSSVASVANSLADTFKDRVQAIYPGTVWCGDGRSATARSGELGLFFFTDTCCRQHDACKLFIRAGETKYGLTNTGLFTRSHCSCDDKFRSCLQRTNSLVSGQIGLTYFNVLGPQCFRKAHPIVKCVRRTRITGQKCEEYELDYTKPKMWQWFDNETF